MTEPKTTSKKFTVNLKFQRSENGRIAGFVTRYSGSWHGCRADEEKPKQIVLLDIKLANIIMPGVLYKAKLIPMRDNAGFVAISASPIQFDATVSTVFNDNKPRVELKFGNKTIIYSPLSNSPKYSDIDSISNHLLHRLDIRNVYEVTQNFIMAASSLKEKVKPA